MSTEHISLSNASNWQQVQMDAVQLASAQNSMNPEREKEGKRK